jgi:RNA polymerase sigma factor (sigma-70 family)
LATRAAQGRTGRSEQGVDARVSKLVGRHERSLMRVARHWSICHDDALDAYQRALEIYVRRLDSLDPATEIAWLRVVVKNEALAIRRDRGESLPFEEVDSDAHAPENQRPVDEVLAGRERVERSAEALRRIKPDEARALMLKAQGLSYKEIGEALSWTYTKVNRCITEGRARFLKVYAEIEAGAECERFAPTLAALVGGTASADALLELRPHIRNCATCRATVRQLHATRLGRPAALWPLPLLVAPLRWVRSRLADASAIQPGPRDAAAGAGGESVPELSPIDDINNFHDVIDAMHAPGSHAAVEGRPRLIDWALQRAGEGVEGVKQHATSAYYRAVDPTPLAGARPGAAVAAVAGCLAIGGGTTYCMTQGVSPIGELTQVVSPAHERKRVEPRTKHRREKHVAVTPVSAPALKPTATPVATPTIAPRQPSPQPAVQSAPQPTPEPTPPPAPEEEYEPLAPATASSAARGSSAPARTPAPAPANGPAEFDGP